MKCRFLLLMNIDGINVSKRVFRSYTQAVIYTREILKIKEGKFYKNILEGRGFRIEIIPVGIIKPRDYRCPVCFSSSYEEMDFNDWDKMKCCDLPIHKECKVILEKNVKKCPSCEGYITDPDKNFPYGTMTVSRIPGTINYKGSNIGIIYCNFSLLGGYNKNGSFLGETRGCYLPDCDDGILVVKKFINAFKKGLLFSIGDSVTRGTKNVIVYWAAHQKTAISGTYGYPDDDYIIRVQNELGCKSIMEGYDVVKNKDELAKGNHKVILNMDLN